MKKAPLSGVRIIEHGQLLAVPFAARMLADLGAEIIKIESPLRLDSYRRTSFPDNDPGDEYWDRGGTFYNENRGKLGMTLDLRVPEAVNIFRDLVRVSDVVMENYTARVMQNFGLSYEELRELKPDIIMLSSTGYGHAGPWGNFKAAGPTTEGASSIAAITGYQDGTPVLPDIPHSDYVAAENAVLAITLALFRRKRTGKGGHIDLSQTETQAAQAGELFLDAAVNHTKPERRTNRHHSLAPYGIYPCQGNDRWIAIAVSTDEEWLALQAAMGKPEWAAESRFSTVKGRLEHVDELEAHLSAWTSAGDYKELTDLLQSQGVQAGAVLDARDLVTNEHLRARGFFEWVEHPEKTGLDAKPYTGAPWHFSESAHGAKMRAPAFGEHNQHVLHDILGYDQSRIDELKAKGAMGTSPAELPRPRPVPLSRLLQQARLVEVDPDYRERIRP